MNSFGISPSSRRGNRLGLEPSFGQPSFYWQAFCIYLADSRLLTSHVTALPGSVGHGLRVTKSSGSSTTVYIFSGGKVVAEYLNGSLSAEYIYLGDKLLATHSGTTLTYHHRDLLSVRLNTDGTTGAVVGEQGHYPYGEVWYSTGTTTKYLFTSYERDPESGNDYAMQRYNANRLGRFMSPDPVMGAATDPQSLNRYAYVANDPIYGVDPNGTSLLFPLWPFGDCMHHPRWDDNTEFWIGLSNVCPFLPWLPFIRELGGGPDQPG